MAWCHEAKVTERVDSGRVRVAWVAKRSFREGTTQYRVRRKRLLEPDRSAAVRWFGLGIWTVKMTLRISALATWGLVRRDARARALRMLRELAHNLGIAAGSLGIRYHEYRG